MQREQNLWGLQCLLWPAHAKLLIYAADSVLAFQFQAPTRFKNARCLFNCVSSTVYHSPYCDTVLNGFWTCPYIYMSALFCLFSSHKFLRLFTFAHPFFSASFCSSFLFSLQFSFIPSFRALVSSPSTLFYHSLLPYSSRIVVIMLILTTLGWCPLNVISSKISAFLSADFQ